MCDDVNQFLRDTRDTRESRRALAVKMALRGTGYTEIVAVLQVSRPFISKWKRIYEEQGVAGFRIGYRGSTGALTPAQRAQTIAWLRDRHIWSLPALRAYLTDTFQVTYRSPQSYYNLLRAAGLSPKQAPVTRPTKRGTRRRAAGRARRPARPRTRRQRIPRITLSTR